MSHQNPRPTLLSSNYGGKTYRPEWLPSQDMDKVVGISTHEHDSILDKMDIRELGNEEVIKCP